jgi:hypothetical protein
VKKVFRGTYRFQEVAVKILKKQMDSRQTQVSGFDWKKLFVLSLKEDDNHSEVFTHHFLIGFCG